MNKKIVFITGTRADFGKLKSLIKKIEQADCFETHVLVTGMHLLSKYGGTYSEVEKSDFKNIHIYKYINQSNETPMDIILSNTILGFSNYINEVRPDMIVVHGDRIEAMAGAIVGAFNNILVAHIEGGELSGSIDNSIRHAITKLSHIHFVANEESKNRVLQMGENEGSIFVIGSPDIDIMMSEDQLQPLKTVKEWYDIEFDKYAILIFHPNTIEYHRLEQDIDTLITAAIESQKNYIVIYPNNDTGSDIIMKKYASIDHERFKIYPSIRFEHFLTLLKNADFIIGNSSAGIREALIYGVPCINIGSRQDSRTRYLKTNHITNTNPEKLPILNAINVASSKKLEPLFHFGEGKSTEDFFNILKNPNVWDINKQKLFIDIENEY